MSDKFVVTVKDFQSIHSANLDFPTGLTIITGKTNGGKTAIFRAIDSALFNKGDDSMISAGKRYSGVSIDNGKHKMMFMRDSVGKNEKTAYQFDGGTVQKKVGRNQLPEVSENFNIRDVRMQNGTKMKINFWYQNDKPFLMDKTAGQLYEFLSLSSCDNYTRVLKTMQTDAKVLDAEIQSISTEIDTLKTINNSKNEFIERNNGFDDVYLRVITLSQEIKKIGIDGDLVESISSLNSRIETLKKTIAEVEDRLKGIPIDYLSSHYKNISDLDKNLIEFMRLLRDLSSVRNTVDVKTEEVKFINRDVNTIIPIVEDSRERIDSICVLDKTVKESSVLISDYKRISENVSNTTDLLHGIRLFNDIESTSLKVDRLRETDDFLRDIQSLIEDIDSKSRLIENMGKSMIVIKDKIVDNQRELEDLKDFAGYCPYCGTVFEKKNV